MICGMIFYILIIISQVIYIKEMCNFYILVIIYNDVILREEKISKIGGMIKKKSYLCSNFSFYVISIF